MSSLISQINESDTAQATAYWDDTTGKLTITSKKEGASYINIEAGTSNFTDVMGLTETTRDENGDVVTSKMYTEAQELGLNASFIVCSLAAVYLLTLTYCIDASEIFWFRSDLYPF